MSSTVDRVVVVVPIRQEVHSLRVCLSHLDAATGRLRQQRGAPVHVALVLDRCTDGSVEVATRYATGRRNVALTSCLAGSVGRARAIGVDLGLRAMGAQDPQHTWIANTDADSMVPARWLVRQLELAERGYDLVTGTVEPVGLAPAAQEQWHQQHLLRDGHPHVHGANLGVRASAYREVGGFRDLTQHEDVMFVEAVRRTGRAVFATDATRVRTSARSYGRTPGGFAGYLSRLTREPEKLPSSGDGMQDGSSRARV